MKIEFTDDELLMIKNYLIFATVRKLGDLDEERSSTDSADEYSKRISGLESDIIKLGLLLGKFQEVQK